MKPIPIIICLFLAFLPASLAAQEVNWRSLNDARHLVSATFGADYSSYYGLSYGYKVNARPVVLGAEMTLPFGYQAFDDWKGKLSAQGELWHNNHFSWTVKATCMARRYASPLARMYSLGAGLSSSFGYLRPRWGLVALAGYDRSLATHILHGELKTQYPEIRDGWYGSSGGNYAFAARLHLSAGPWSSFLTLGKAFAQNFSDNPTLPFFAEVSLQKRF